jgi:hypothetical protein
VTRFPLARSRWTPWLLGPFGAGRPVAELDDRTLRIGMGVVGGGRIPVELISGVGTMRWPWWGGVGVRIAQGLTAFAARSGPAVLLDLSAPVSVRAPLPWKTRRVAVVVEDIEGFTQAVVDARGGEIRRLGDRD